MIRSSSRHIVLYAACAALALAYARPSAQTVAKRAMTVEDYTKWHSISGQEISGDGKWVTYTLQLTNVAPTDTKPVLHLVNLETNDDVSVANASGGLFSSDSKWLAYSVDPSGGRGRGRGGRGGNDGPNAPAPGPPPPTAPPLETLPTPQQPATPLPTTPDAPNTQAGRGNQPPAPPQRVELRNLQTGAIQSWQDIQSFVFAPNASYLVLKRRAENGANAAAGRGSAQGGGGGAAPATNASGNPRPRRRDRAAPTSCSHDLETGRDQLLGSVGDIAFTKAGDLLAYAVDATVKDANGVFVFDLAHRPRHAARQRRASATAG